MRRRRGTFGDSMFDGMVADSGRQESKEREEYVRLDIFLSCLSCLVTDERLNTRVVL